MADVERQPDPTTPPPFVPDRPPADAGGGAASGAGADAAADADVQRSGIPDGSDADLWVFSFDGLMRAQEAMLAVSRLSARRHLDLEDAAIVTLRRGRVRL
ncbi:MAG: hypothetical protein O3C70_01930, partial [Actinomycetota bacterium]|nr:hypothetical protein [Actinomycetota bacterium]